MASMERIRVEWTGLTGLPGVTTLFADPTVPTAYAAVHQFFDDIKDYFPSGLTWSFPAFGDLIDDGTGALSGSWSTTPLPPINGTVNMATHAAGVGLRVKWNTNGISSSNRRVTGATFLTALASLYFDTDGTINSIALADIQTAADTMVAAADFRVWTRPVGGSGGTSNAVLSATVPDRVTSLRSRRL